MSEFSEPIQTIDVRGLDPCDLSYDAYDQKAILAMQTAGAYADGDESFHDLNARLHTAADTISEPPVMTYEDLIFTNPVFGGSRVMSTDKGVAEYEARFYRAHRVIEGNLHLAIRKIMAFGDNAERFAEVESFQAEPIATTETTSVKPEDDVKVALKGLKGLRTGIDPDIFKSFRIYFTDGLNGYAGPSGLYSATIPILDLVTHGGINIPDGVRTFMSKSIDRGMYPNRAGHTDLFKYLLEAEDPSMEMPNESREDITNSLNLFRHAHSGAVRKLLPKVYSGEQPGSGGIEDYQELARTKIVEK